MKSALSLALMASLVGPALPVAAQDRMASTDGPIASAATRAAVRVAADQQSETADLDWSRVRQLAPGAEVIVTLKDTPPVERYFVAADGSDLTVLNLTDPALHGAAMRELRDLASNHPEYFTQQGVFADQEILLGPDGAFLAHRKVADLGQIVERIARTDVAEIGSPVKTRGSVGLAVAGAAAGLGLGYGLRMSTIDCPFVRDCWGWRLWATAPLWLPVLGGFIGYHQSHHEVGGVIYRAP